MRSGLEWAVLAIGLLALPTSASAAIPPPNEAAAEQVEAQCMIYAQELGTTGKALASSVQGCVAQERPDLAVWESCRSRGRAEGDKGALLQEFVTNCLHSSP